MIPFGPGLRGPYSLGWQARAREAMNSASNGRRIEVIWQGQVHLSLLGRTRSSRSIDPRKHLAQIDGDSSPCDAPANSVADDAASSFGTAHLDREVAPIDEPHLLKSQREVRVALELTVVHPR